MELSCWGEPFAGTRLLSTGVGAPQTLATLFSLSDPVRCLVQIGIAGAYPDSGWGIGDVVVARSDRFVDLGMELPEPPGFLPLDQTPFGNRSSRIFPLRVPAAAAEAAGVVDAATVSSCTGTDATGILRRDLFAAEIETMEGAALAMVADAWRVPLVQVRAISNRAGNRSIDLAGIHAASNSLREWLSVNRSAIVDELMDDVLVAR